MGRFPAEVAPPLTVALARAIAEIPAADGLPGGASYEPKWDGFRVVVVKDGDITIWSRQQRDLTQAFPDLAAAAADALPDGFIVDGEAIVRENGCLNFGALQQRLIVRHERREREVAERPASFVAFDLLALDYRDTRHLALRDRRRLLEQLAADWERPLELSPTTGDRAQAQRWFDELPASGIEGLVVKGAAQPYRGGRRDWLKVKHRDTVDVIAAAVTGTRAHPREVIVGLARDGELNIVGHSTVLSKAAAAELAGVIAPPRGDHPWPTRIAGNRWRSKATELTLIEPIVIEVSADTARDNDVFRHPVRFVRVRPELAPTDLGYAGASSPPGPTKPLP
jgi:ATP-dependent DNA ligase